MANPLLPYDAIISSIFDSLHFFHVFSGSFVKWTGNMLAHALAHLPLSSMNYLEACDLPANLALII